MLPTFYTCDSERCGDAALLQLQCNVIQTLACVLWLSAGTREQGDCDVYSRFFAPWTGVNEDPVTGRHDSVRLCVGHTFNQRGGM